MLADPHNSLDQFEEAPSRPDPRAQPSSGPDFNDDPPLLEDLGIGGCPAAGPGNPRARRG